MARARLLSLAIVLVTLVAWGFWSRERVPEQPLVPVGETVEHPPGERVQESQQGSSPSLLPSPVPAPSISLTLDVLSRYGPVVRCRIQGVPSEVRVLGGKVAGLAVMTEPGRLAFSVREPQGRSWLMAEHGEPTGDTVLVQWDADRPEGSRCLNEPLRWTSSATLEGRVVDHDGTPIPGGRVEGCGDELSVDGGGTFLGEIPPDPCVFTAVLGDLPGDPLELDPQPGELVEVTLVHPGAAHIRATVVNTAGNPEPAVRVHGCGASTTADSEGVARLIVPAGPCEVEASRKDGWWHTPSAPVEVELAVGERVELTLVLDEYQRGGLGYRFASWSSLVIEEVYPGTPAERGGLQAGDRIVSVDGVSTEGWSARGLIDQITGPDGTSVELTVESVDGRTWTRSFVREPMGDE